MSHFLRAFREQARKQPEALACLSSNGESLTYGQLDRLSGFVASGLQAMGGNRCPVALLGHKEPAMVVLMLGCMRAGRPYVPLDVTFPEYRVAAILEQLEDAILVEVTPAPYDVSVPRIAYEDLVSEGERLFTGESSEGELLPDVNLAQYIIFTSGSTGAPKGVEQPYASLDATYRYFERFLPEGDNLTLFNRAPFSFDLSLFDFAIAFPFGHCLFTLDIETEESLASTFRALREADIDLWVSTPSFATICLADPSFNEELLPRLRSFVFCGETLPGSTALGLIRRFPQADVFNSYGPSETQAAVTDVLVTEVMASSAEPLPVGKPSPFNKIWVADPDTLEPLANGTRGEILIAGDTLALGYYGREDLTVKAFIEVGPFAHFDLTDQQLRSYRTGDEGYFDAEGLLHFVGRYDLQVKVNGYRIELQEIEELLGRLDGVTACCVIPLQRKGVNTALAAHVALAEGFEPGRQEARRIKGELKAMLPGYMVPRTISFHDALPTTVNGKIDRKALAVEGGTVS